MKNNIIENLQLQNRITIQEQEFILDKIEIVQYNKGELLLEEGHLCKFTGLIIEGLVMFFNINDKGDEIACDFLKENDWVTQYESLTTGKKAPISIKAIEPTTIHKLSKENIELISKEIPLIEQAIKPIIEKFLFKTLERNNSFQNLKAEQRYELFLKNNFELSQRVPQYYLAGNLGIAPQSLSRIRSKKSS